MVKDLAKPGEDIIASLTPLSAHTLHMAIGLSGEVAELKEHSLLTMAEAVASDSSVLEELGDIEFYFEGLCQSMFSTLEPTGITADNPFCVDQLVVVAGNMLDLVKKMVVYNKQIPLMDFVNQLIEVRKHLDMVHVFYGATQAQAQVHNMNKLLKSKTARYKEGSYSDDAAQSRRDKTTE